MKRMPPAGLGTEEFRQHAIQHYGMNLAIAVVDMVQVGFGTNLTKSQEESVRVSVCRGTPVYVEGNGAFNQSTFEGFKFPTKRGMSFRGLLKPWVEATPEGKLGVRCGGAGKQYLDMTVCDFLREHETQGTVALHPMNVIDLNMALVPGFETVKPPNIVKRLSIGHAVEQWYPEAADEFHLTKPVSWYLLMTERGAQTQFHYDMTGTSVFYQVITGTKEFWIMQNTPNNMNQIDKWNSIPVAKYSSFFADSMHVNGTCTRLTLHAGDALFLPAGWLHFVYTPEDTVVFGINFLVAAHMPIFLSRYVFERATHKPILSCFPNFEILMILYMHLRMGMKIRPRLKPRKHYPELLLAMQFYGGKRSMTTVNFKKLASLVPSFDFPKLFQWANTIPDKTRRAHLVPLVRDLYLQKAPKSPSSSSSSSSSPDDDHSDPDAYLSSDNAQ